MLLGERDGRSGAGHRGPACGGRETIGRVGREFQAARGVRAQQDRPDLQQVQCHLSHMRQTIEQPVQSAGAHGDAQQQLVQLHVVLARVAVARRSQETRVLQAPGGLLAKTSTVQYVKAVDTVMAKSLIYILYRHFNPLARIPFY